MFVISSLYCIILWERLCPNEHFPIICLKCSMKDVFSSNRDCIDCYNLYSSFSLSCGVLHRIVIIGGGDQYFYDASHSLCPLCYRVVFCKCHVVSIELQKHQCKDCLKDRYFQVDVIEHTCANHGHDDGGKTIKVAKCED